MQPRDTKILTVIKIQAIIIPIVVVLIAVIMEFMYPDERDMDMYFCDTYDVDWERVYEDGSRAKIDIPGKYDAAPGELFVLESTIEKKLCDAGYLALMNDRMDTKVYIGGQLRKAYSTEDTRPVGDNSATSYIFIHVMPEDEGMILQLQLKSNSPYSGVFSKMYYGTQTGIWLNISRLRAPEIFVGIFMMIASIICIIFSEYARFIKHEESEVEFLGWGVFAAALWVITSSPYRQIILPNSSVISDLNFFSLMLLPTPIMLYIDQEQGYRYKFAYRIAHSIALLDMIACTVLHYTGIVHFAYSVKAMFATIIISIFLIMMTMLTDLVKHRIRPYKLVAIGFIGASGAGVFQIVAYLTHILDFNGTILCLGFIFMLGMAATKAVRDFINIENEKQEAVRTTKLQEQFLASMSHEIRTPLNAIIGLNEMIMRESSQKEIREYSSDIKGAGKMLLGLINDILDFSKIESGKVELVPNKYWVSFVLTDSYNLIAKRAEDKGVNIIVDCDPNVPEQLFGDETRVRQIMSNLLTNAIKYTDEGSITMRLTWRKISIEDAMIRFSVKDTGIGISQEDQKKLFKSFQRVDETRNRNIEGTGLGLVISKQLVEIMGGRIWVESEYGVGSEFTVEFPQRIVSERGMGQFKPHVVIDEMEFMQTANFRAPSARILIVDDVPANLKVAANLLKDTDIKIDLAKSGAEFLSLTDVVKYDMIFLDHRMPVMDGVEAFKKMKEDEDNLNLTTPVVMLTANVVAGAKENYLKEGFTDYLTKPIRQAEFKQMLIDHLPDELIITS